MVLTVNDKAQEIYASNFLNYALNCLEEQGSFDKYAEWLQTQPVMSFTDKTAWTYNAETGDLIHSDEDESMEYEVTLAIELDSGEMVYHSIYAGNSWFFRKLEDGKMEALYVD